MSDRRASKTFRGAAVSRGAGLAVAGGALIGAAAGRIARDRAARRATDRRQAFRLDAGEDVAAGIRRIARGQIDQTLERLRDGAGADPGEAIHESRKALKRARAIVRLVRDALDAETYRRENGTFRAAGRSLSGARDAKVLVDTLDALAKRYADELPDQAFATLRAALVADYERAREALGRDAPALAEVLRELEAARARVAVWPLGDDDGAAILANGLERIYERGRRAVRAARDETTEESLHELRKRTKDLWHAAQIVERVAPDEMGKLAKRAHKLSDVIGDDHDLSVLAAAAAVRPDTLRGGERALLEGLISRRQAELQPEAIRRARRLYAGKGRKLVRPLTAALS